MKNWFLLSMIVVASLAIISCGKKEEGPPPPAGCPPEHVVSPYYGRCVYRGQCPQGLVQNPNEPTMCTDPMTGNNHMTQQCGTGFVLTTEAGCVRQGPCNPGQGWDGSACRNAVGGGGFQQQMNGGAGGWGTSMYGGSPYGAYQNPSGWGMPRPYGY